MNWELNLGRPSKAVAFLGLCFAWVGCGPSDVADDSGVVASAPTLAVKHGNWTCFIYQGELLECRETSDFKEGLLYWDPPVDAVVDVAVHYLQVDFEWYNAPFAILEDGRLYPSVEGLEDLRFVSFAHTREDLCMLSTAGSLHCMKWGMTNHYEIDYVQPLSKIDGEIATWVGLDTSGLLTTFWLPTVDASSWGPFSGVEGRPADHVVASYRAGCIYNDGGVYCQIDEVDCVDTDLLAELDPESLRIEGDVFCGTNFVGENVCYYSDFDDRLEEMDISAVDEALVFNVPDRGEFCGIFDGGSIECFSLSEE
jgi:hypothetical protein